MNNQNTSSYWENKKVTSEEFAIFEYLKNNIKSNSDILHIGVGCSHGVQILKNKFNSFTGLTIAGLEKNKADSLNIENNSTIIVDKYDHNKLIKIIKFKTFDYIIDINLKSFSPNNQMYENMMKNFYNFLKIGGCIITSESGMNWTTKLNLVYNNFMQIGGNEENILSKNDLEKFAQKFNLSFEEITQKYGFFKRKSETLYKLVKK
jgi:hypothetical protein